MPPQLNGAACKDHALPRTRSERPLKRILVVSDRHIDFDFFRNELERQPPDDLEVFVLYPVREGAIRGLLWGRRFWRARHAELDHVLDALADMGVVSDGLATAESPNESVGHALDAFRPQEVLIVRTRRVRHHEESLRGTLAAHTRDTGHPIKTSWLPT